MNIPPPMAGGVDLGPRTFHRTGYIGLPSGYRLEDLKQSGLEIALAELALLPTPAPRLPQRGIPQFTTGPDRARYALLRQLESEIPMLNAAGAMPLFSQYPITSMLPGYNRFPAAYDYSAIVRGSSGPAGKRPTTSFDFTQYPTTSTWYGYSVAEAMALAGIKPGKENVGVKKTGMSLEMSLFADSVKELGLSMKDTFSQDMIQSLFSFGEAMAQGATAGEAAVLGIMDFLQQISRILPQLLLTAGLKALFIPGMEGAGIALIAASGVVAITGGIASGSISQMKSEYNARPATVQNNTYVEGNIFVDDELDRRAVMAVGQSGRGW